MGIASICALIPTTWVYWHLCLPPGEISLQLPKPNGYDRLVTIGGALESDMPVLASNAPEPPGDQFAGYVARNQRLLGEARLALEAPSRARLDTNFSDHDRSLLYKVAFALEQQAVVARNEMRYGDAAQSGLDIMRFSHQATHGGALSHWAVGISCERRGERWLRQYRRELAGADRRIAIDQLAKIDRQREPYSVVVARTFQWPPYVKIVEENLGWAGRVADALEMLIPERHPQYQLNDNWEKRRITTLRLLLIDLAVRAYQSENGAPPQRLTDLVPQYLKRIPHDPFCEVPFIYRPKKNSFELYSVGLNGVDDGGHFPRISELYDLPKEGDYCLDQKNMW